MRPFKCVSAAATFSLSHEIPLVIVTVRLQPSGRTRSCGSPDHFRIRRPGIVYDYDGIISCYKMYRRVYYACAIYSKQAGYRVFFLY